MTQLFRFSALTFNPHRIHYDIKYCQNVEKYPNLVIHGPLIVLQMMHFIENMTGYHMLSFKYKFFKPTFLGTTISLKAKDNGEIILVWAVNPKNEILCEAEATVGSFE